MLPDIPQPLESEYPFHGSRNPDKKRWGFAIYPWCRRSIVKVNWRIPPHIMGYNGYAEIQCQGGMEDEFFAGKEK